MGRAIDQDGILRQARICDRVAHRVMAIERVVEILVAVDEGDAAMAVGDQQAGKPVEIAVIVHVDPAIAVIALLTPMNDEWPPGLEEIGDALVVLAWQVNDEAVDAVVADIA